MFEKLLERVLVQYFGRYISGLDENSIHLGVFSGDLRIENVSLKPSCLDGIDLPLEILYSNIGLLSAKISWSKLSSSPVPITLQDVYVVIGIKKQEDWKFNPESIEDKLKEFESYGSLLLQRIIEIKSKGKGDNDQESMGYMTKMGMKIVDNIQLMIKNVNIRFEYREQNCAFGISLQQLSAVTTDNKWNVQFIDRTNQTSNNSNDYQMYKLVQLQNLRVYWNNKYNPINLNYSNQIHRNQIILAMKQISQQETMNSIQDEFKQVFQINGECKVINNSNDKSNKGSKQQALYEIQLKLDDIHLRMDHDQLQILANILDASNQYKQQVFQEKNKHVQPDETQLETHRVQFSRIFLNNLRKIHLKEKQQQLPEDSISLNNIIGTVNQNIITLWIRSLIRTLAKDLKMSEITQKKKKGFFSFASKNTNSVITEEQIKEIEDTIEEELEKEKDNTSERSDDSLDARLQVTLDKGSFCIQGTNNNSEIKFEYEKLMINTESFADDTKIVKVLLKEVELVFLEGPQANQRVVQHKIIQRTSEDSQQYSNPHFIDVTFTRFGLSTIKKQSNKNIFGKLTGSLQPLDFNYNAKCIRELQDVLDLNKQSIYVNKQQIINIISDKLYSQNSVEGEDVISKTESELKKQQQLESSEDSKYLEVKVDIGRQTVILRSNSNQVWSASVQNMSFIIQDNNKCQILASGVEVARSTKKILKQSEDGQIINENIVQQFDLNVILDYSKQQCMNISIDCSQIIIKASTKILQEGLTVLKQLSLEKTKKNELILAQKKQLEKSSIINQIVSFRERKFYQFQQVQLIIDSYNRLSMYHFINHDEISIKPFYTNHISALIDLEVSQQEKQEDQQEQGEQLEVHSLNGQLRLKFNDKDSLNKLMFLIQEYKSKSIQSSQVFDSNINELLLQSSMKQQKQQVQEQSREQQQPEQKSLNTSICVKVPYILVSILNDEQESQLDMVVKQLQFTQSSTAKNISTIAIQLQSISLIDYTFIYTNADYQALFSATPNDGNINIRLGYIQFILFQFFFEDNALSVIIEDDKNNDIMKIKCKIGTGVLNWKPDSILLLTEIAENITSNVYPSKELSRDNLQQLISQVLSDQRFKALQQKHKENDNNSDESEYQQMEIDFSDYSSCLLHKIVQKSELEIDVDLSNFSLLLITDVSHNPFIKLDLINTKLDIKFTQQGKFFNVSIPDIILSDLSNYPNTFNYTDNINSSQVIACRCATNKQENLINIKYSMFYSMVNKQKIDSFCSIFVSPISLNYNNQQILRISDYFLLSILSIISHSKQIRQKQNQERSGILGSVEQLLSQCLCPTFIQFDIQLNKPEIQFKSTYTDPNTFILFVQSVSIQSKYFQTQKRLSKQKLNSSTTLEKKDSFIQSQSSLEHFSNGLWVCQYLINGQECSILELKADGSMPSISSQFNLDLNFERLLFNEETVYLFGDIKNNIVVEHRLQGEIQSIIMNLNSNQYQEIIKMMMHNFNFEDGKNNLFLSTDTLNNIIAKPIQVEITADGIGLVLLDQRTMLPKVFLEVDNTKILWSRNSQKSVQLSVLNKDVQLQMISLKEGILCGCEILGQQIGKITQYDNIADISEQFNQKFKSNRQHISLNRQQSSCSNNSTPQDGQYKLVYKEEKAKNEDRSITLELTNITTLLQTDAFLELFNWAQPLPSCYPKYLEKEEESRLVLIFTAKNVISAFPSRLGKEVIAMRGDVSVIFVRQRMHNHEIIRDRLIEGEIKEQDLGDLITYNIAFSDFEVFSCDFQQLVEKDFSEVRKRNLLHPVTAAFKSKYDLGIGPKPQQSLYFLARNEGHIQKTKIKFSFRNLRLVIKTVMQQLEFLKQNKKAEEGRVQQIEAIEQQQQVEHIPTNSTFDIEVEELQIQLIDDSKAKSSIPVLSFRMLENKLLYNFSENQKKNISLSAIMQLSYYNSQSSFWEPVLERTQFLIDYLHNPTSNPKNYLSLEIAEDTDININVSKNMLQLLEESLNEITLQLKEFISDIKADSNSLLDSASNLMDEQETQTATPIDSSYVSKSSLRKGENIEQISPFSISNKIGYAIVIENEKSHQYIIQDNQTVNYQVDEDDSYESQTSSFGKKVSIAIISEAQSFHPITDLNLGLIKAKKIQLQPTKGGSLNAEPVIIMLESSIQTSRKLLEIHSLYSIQNKTDQSIDFLLSQTAKVNSNSKKLIFPPESINYIPIDRLDHIFQFKFTNGTDYSEMVSLPKLKNINNNTSFEMRHNGKKCSTYLRIMKLESETRLVFEPFITIKNCLPMNVEIGILIQNEKKDAVEGDLHYQQSIHVHNANLLSQVQMQLKVPGFQGSDYLIISSPMRTIQNQSNPVVVPETLNLVDFRGCQFPLSIKSEIKPFGAKTFYLYSQCLLISTVPNDLFYFSKRGDSINLSPGQKISNIPQTEYVSHLGKISLFQSTNSLMISCTDKGAKLSRALNLTGIGNDTIDVHTALGQQHIGDQCRRKFARSRLRSEDIFQDCIADSKVCGNIQSLRKNDKINVLFEKILNQTEYTIMIRQENSESQIILVYPGERIPLSWADSNKNKNYNVMISDSNKNKKYGWSGTLNLALSSISFALRNPQSFSETKYLKASIRQQKHYFFLQFIELKKDINPSYTIQNGLTDTTLVVYQGCFFNQKNAQYKDNYYKINSGEKIDYSQDLPTLPNDLIVEFKFENSRKGMAMEPLVLDLECPQYENMFILPYPNSDNKQVKFFIEIGFEGAVKAIRLIEEEEKRKKLLQEKKSGIEWQVNVFLPSVGVSLIGRVEKEVKEIVYFSLKGLEFALVETNKLRTIQLKTQNIQIDNNISYNTIYPVTITTSKQQQKIPHLSLVIEQDISVQQITKIQSLRLAFQQTTLKLTDELVSSILNFSQEFTHPLFNSQSTEMCTPQDCDNVQKGNGNLSSYSFPWMTETFPKLKRLMFVQMMELYPIGLNLSFKKIRENNTSEKLDILQNVLKAVGIALANVEGAGIKLKGIKYQNIIESQDAILNRLFASYKDSLLNQTLQILGSANIIGNPVSLFKNIGTGVSDLIEMPLDGFVKGPIEGGVGVVLGAGSLIKNTVSGTFSSVQGITDSIGTGVSQLSMDKDYMRQRDKIKRKKASHVGTGVKLGLQSLFTGIGGGIVGLVSKPIEGAEKGGAFGFMKGITKGIAGLVIKPITGVIDAASKTAEGIKNTATYFDDKPSENRLRPPRVFYNRERYFQDYIYHDAELIGMLQTYKKGKFADIQLVQTCFIQHQQEQFILILSIQQVMLFSVKSKQILFSFSSYNIQNICESNKGVIIFLHEATQEIPDRQAALFIDNLADRGSVFKKVFNLVEQLN